MKEEPRLKHEYPAGRGGLYRAQIKDWKTGEVLLQMPGGQRDRDDAVRVMRVVKLAHYEEIRDELEKEQHELPLSSTDKTTAWWVVRTGALVALGIIIGYLIF